MSKHWTVPPTAFTKTINDDAVGLACNMLKDAAPYLILGTPVMDGTARGNYRFAINLPDYGFDLGARDVGGISTANKGVAFIVNNFKLGDIIYISNSLPYIWRLEHGWSDQAPNGMFQLTMNYLESKYG